MLHRRLWRPGAGRRLLRRQDADGWYASLGGFYTTQKGVRNTQYPSDQGYQLEGTATHPLDDGKLQAYFRMTDTNTPFFTVDGRRGESRRKDLDHEPTQFA